MPQTSNYIRAKGTLLARDELHLLLEVANTATRVQMKDALLAANVLAAELNVLMQDLIDAQPGPP